MEGDQLPAMNDTPAPSSRKITIADYDPAWPSWFERAADQIRQALGATALQIDHVGSTSVPGLPAKPLIDINLLVADPTNESGYVPHLEALGYALTIREPEWYEHRMLRGTAPPVNLHVFAATCPEPRRMIAFRDRLRSHEADRDLYARTKRELAARNWEQVQDYSDAKSEVVAEILARSQAA